MASRFDEAMAFLLDQSKVTLYSNAERSAAPCPECFAPQGKPCTFPTRKGKEKRGEPHEERRNQLTPRSEDELLDLLEKLARKYARPYDPMESFGPRNYPTPRWAKEKAC